MKLCWNSIVNIGEEFDDGNILNNDDCFDCRIEFGWSCLAGVCTMKCSNGLREVGEDCDDGNTIDNDGCTSCKIDLDFKCDGGSPSTIDVCLLVTDVCGDEYKKRSRGRLF